MKKPCSCLPGDINPLPRGLRCNKGYLELRLEHKGTIVQEAFGLDTKDHRKLAKLRIAELSVMLDRGTYKAPTELVDVTVAEAWDIFYKFHSHNLSSDAARASMEWHGEVIKARLGHFVYGDLNFVHIEEWINEFIASGASPWTPKKYLMWLSNMYTKFEFWNQTVPAKLKQKVRLPEKDPVKLARLSIGPKKLSTVGQNRDRVPARDEMKLLKIWCKANDPELGDAIGQAIITFLRKKDLIKRQDQQGEKLVQSKTGKVVLTPISFPRPVGFVNWRRRWNKLRRAMGWSERGTSTHTTWHDLRHVGGTWLAEWGYSQELIAQLLGDTVKQSMTYTNVKVAAEAVQKEWESL